MRGILASLNGKVLPLEEARVPVLDRGFLFGDGVYEVARIYRRRPFLLDEHLRRLENSLGGLKIACDTARLADRARALVERAAEDEAILYIQVTRGVGAVRTHAFPQGVEPTELLYVAPHSPISRAERERGESAVTYPDVRWDRRDLKTINLLGNVMAAQAAREAGAYEAILVDRHGKVTEGSRTNVLAVSRGRVVTRALGTEILPGVTRELVLRLAREAGIAVEERAFSAGECLGMDEVFLTGTTTEVMPIVRIDGQPVGDGKAGPVTLKLAELFISYALRASA